MTMTSTSSSSTSTNDHLSSLLDSPSFSIPLYLNTALSDSSSDSTSLSDRLTSLALQLQLITQSSHDDIARIGAELHAVLPRCAADVHRVTSTLESIDIPVVEEDGGDERRTMTELIELSTNLTTARSVIAAACEWDEAKRSVPELLAGAAVDRAGLPLAVEAIVSLRQKEEALRVVGEGREERANEVKVLVERAEAMLRPGLRHALVEERGGLLRQCAEMYASLGMGGILREEYVKARRGGSVGVWFEWRGREKDVDDFSFEDQHGEGLDGSSAQSFAEFLPTFYESVLDLLSNERNQARLVFGSELAPSVVTEVWMECFKPIVNSFEKRLESLCPPPGSGAGGGMESIVSAYESTVRFISLAYDLIEAWEAPPDDTTQPSLVETIRRTIVLIASPFVRYQKELAEMERHPLGEAASIVAKDVRSVNSFEDAAERLRDLAPFMFPLAEAVVDRFELLNSGYNPQSTLSAIDSLLSNHASELAIAVGTLSGNATSSTAEFDEQRVHCSLEVLRTAGVFKRSLGSFEKSVGDRLMVLSDQMLDVGLDGGSSVPDALTPAQIRSLLAREVCDPSSSVRDSELPPSVVHLRQLASINESSTLHLFPLTRESTSRLARNCQSFVFEVCYAIPERHLRGISALPVWKQEGSSMGGDDDSYGILPQSFITHVGEHMLALVQALEPFASDDEALGLANEVMGGVGAVAVQPWKEFVAAAGCSSSGGDDIETLEELMGGKTLPKYLMDGEDVREEPMEHEEDDPESSASTIFCNRWLDVVGTAVTGRLLERTMRIPRLGSKGAEHLAADLNYIRNVFTALGVLGHPNPLLEHVARLAMLDGGKLRDWIIGRKEGGMGAHGVIVKAELRMAYIRNVSVQKSF